MDVQEWVRGHESAQEMLRRLLPRTAAVAPLVPALQRHVSLHGRHVVEVAGSSGSAKSEFLLQAAVKALLPKQGYNGWEGGVLWFDLDGHFDVLRLLRLLQARIHERALLRETETEEEKDGVVEDGEQVLRACLERFIYARCYNSLDFIVALQNARNQLIQTQSQGNNVSLLVVDSIAAFYWLDRAAPSTGGTSAERMSLSIQGVMQAVVRELRNLSHAYGLLVMASKCNIYSSNFSDNADWLGGYHLHKQSIEPEASAVKDGKRTGYQAREFMPAVWQEFVTHRLLLKCQAGEAGTVFTAEWLVPLLSQVDKFTVHDTGFTLTT